MSCVIEFQVVLKNMIIKFLSSVAFQIGFCYEVVKKFEKSSPIVWPYFVSREHTKFISKIYQLFLFIFIIYLIVFPKFKFLNDIKFIIFFFLISLLFEIFESTMSIISILHMSSNHIFLYLWLDILLR